MNTIDTTPKPRSRRQTIRRLRAIYRMYAERYLDALIVYYNDRAETHEESLDKQARIHDAMDTIACEIACWIKYPESNRSVSDRIRKRAGDIPGDGARRQYLHDVATDLEERLSDPARFRDRDIPMPVYTPAAAA